jgi:hypothetical protein
MISSIADRVRGIQTAVGRTALAPLLVRGGIFLSALIAFAVAYPARLLLGRPLGLLVIVALLPAVAPRRFWPTLTVLVGVGGWLLSTSWYGEPVVLWRLLALATFLYLTHSLCALAAFLPYDAAVAPEALSQWVARALAVALGAAVLAVLLIGIAQRGGDRTFLAAAVGGLAVAVAACALLAWLIRRR